MFSECHLFEPPNPVHKFYYKCDKMFHLEDLLKLYVVHDTYAIVLISGKRTDFYSYSQNNVQLIKSISVTLPNQNRAGGSSSARFGLIRDEKIGWYVTNIADQMIKLFVKDNVFQHLGLYLAGPAELKKQLQDEQLFVQHFSKHLKQVLTIGEITEQSINQVIKVIGDSIYGTFKDDTEFEAFELLLQQNMDLMVFGTDVLTLLESGDLAQLFIDQHDLSLLDGLNVDKVKMTTMNEQFKKKYDMVGVRYYANNYDYEEV